MPELVIAGSSTSGSSAASPPPAAFQPVLRILKRPTATPSSSTSSITTSSIASSKASSNTYAEREARYQAARDRIFGDTSPAPSSPEDPNLQKGAALRTNLPPVQVSREPKGPPVLPSGATSPSSRGDSSDSRGFSSRRGKRRGGQS